MQNTITTSWIVAVSNFAKRLQLRERLYSVLFISKQNILNKTILLKLHLRRLCHANPWDTHTFWIAYSKFNRKSSIITDSNIIFDKSNNTEFNHCASSQFHTCLESKWVFPHLAVFKGRIVQVYVVSDQTQIVCLIPKLRDLKNTQYN